MKKFVVMSVFLVTIVAGGIFPAPQREDEVIHDRANRHRRVTCDLLGFTGDTACAANCLSMGKAGGSCSGAICICRSDTFEDVWDRRMSMTVEPPPRLKNVPDPWGRD